MDTEDRQTTHIACNSMSLESSDQTSRSGLLLRELGDRSDFNILSVPLMNDREGSRCTTNQRTIGCRTTKQITALHVKINGVDQLCVENVASVLNEIYENVGTVASSYQVEIAEARCSSFVLVCDDAADPASSGSFCEFQQDQPIITSLVRLLSLVIDLHRRLQLTQAQHGGLWLSMGIASGSVTLLGCGSGAAWSPWTALPVRDDAAQLAEEMAAAAAGDRSAVAVHESALWRWAAAATSKTRTAPDAKPHATTYLHTYT